jgi:hypothetical protein
VDDAGNTDDSASGSDISLNVLSSSH